VGETRLEYTDAAVARRAGRPDLLAPPTYLFCLTLGNEDPWSWARAAGFDMARTFHGEQSFTYHRAVHAGDRLVLTSTTDPPESLPGLRRVRRRTTVSRSGHPVADLMTTLVSSPEPSTRRRRGDDARGAAGQPMNTIRTPQLTADVVATFARASGDDNPLHRNLDAARAAGLESVPVHGMLSMAYLARLATATRPQEQLASLTVRFVAPTPLGSSPTFTAMTDAAPPNRQDGVALVGRLEDGTITVRGTANYRP
jgi:acyl dehydratase